MKQNKTTVAVTGGIGSGKSTVLNILSSLGYPVFSADDVARHIYDDADVLEQTKKAFPECIKNGEVDRKELAHIVFSDEKKRIELEKITHPSIMRILDAQMRDAKGELVFAEVPLLFECGMENRFDRVIVVLRNKNERIRAAALRDGVSEDEIAARVKNQFDYEKKAILGHTVIYNDQDRADLEKQVLKIVDEFIRASKD